jgi:curli production assembly/transport component CsgE
LRFLGVFLSIFISFNCFSQELSGLLFDQTKTRLGREFYETFSSFWEFPPGSEFNLTVSELTDPRTGTQIYVYVDEVLVYGTLLRGRGEEMEEKAQEAVDAVLRYLLLKQEEERALSQTFL